MALNRYAPYLTNVMRIFSIALLAVYVALAAGVTVQHHTCGSTTTADLSPLPLEDPCGCDPWELPATRCCTVEVKTFQLQDEQSVTAIVTAPTVNVLPVLHTTAVSPIIDAIPLTQQFFCDTSPGRSVPATILNCTFLI